MRILKKGISACKILLCTSVLINLLLAGVIYVVESHTHLFQGVLVRRGLISGTIDDKQSPDYWARVGWTNTVQKLHTDFDIAFFGNSITRGSDFQLSFPDRKIINLGYSGDNILGMIKRVPMLQAANPKKVFIMAGTNDLVHMDLDTYKQRYTDLIRTINDSLPQTKIYLESVLPTNHELGNFAPNNKVIEANKIVQQLAKAHNCIYINLYDLYVGKDGELPKEITKDGVHLYPQHYARWATAITPLIYE